MDIKVISKTEDKATLLLTDSNPVIANTLRRLMMTEVPVLAIEDCEFIKNDSALYDEIIAHRLGLIPLTTDLESYNLKEDCKCKEKGCSLCQLHLSLRAKGPCIVFASDIKSRDSKVKPVHPDIPIVKLLKGQKLEIDMKAILGKGKEHSKWSSCLVYYRYYPKINVGDAKNPDKAREVCPKDVFDVKNGKLTIKNLEACDLCEACIPYGVEVKHKADEILFFVESWGQLEIKDILSNSIKILDDKLDELDKKIKD